MSRSWKCAMGAVVLYLGVLTWVVIDLSEHGKAVDDVMYLKVAAVLLGLLVGVVAIVDGRKQIKARRDRA